MPDSQSHDTIELSSFGNQSPRDSITFEKTRIRTRSDGGQNSGGHMGNRVGRPPQLNRSFGSLSILALSLTLLSTWESVGSTFAAGLLNGGPASLVWGMILSLTGTLATAMSLAEMASICPIAGAQYHWTAIFAPPKAKVFMTWMQGWITVFAWQAAVTSVCQLVAMQTLGLIILNYPDYVAQRWEVMLMMWAVMILSFVFNVYGIKALPLVQLFSGIMHVAFFIPIVVPLVLLARRSTPEFVFTALLNEGGWESNGVSFCIGMLTVVYCFLGFDGAIHMSEEVRNAPTVIPRIIVQSIAINGGLAFIFILVLLFCIGNVSDALSTPTGFPMIMIFYQATGSVKAATAMESAIIIIGFFSNIGIVASVSRLTWAFARDGGLPFSDFFSLVDPNYHVPFRSIGLVCLTVVLLSLINVASSTALSAILALSTASLYISYLIPIVLLVIKRLRVATDPEPVVFGPWTLGRWGMAVNLYALIFGIFICIFMPFPTTIPVTALNMNYAGPVFAFICILFVCDWFFRGKRKYTGPLKELLQPPDQRSGKGSSLG